MTKEQEILKAAEEEFFHKGYDGASTASIAKAVGVTHAMVNYYFRTKENIFMMILDEHIHGLLESLKPIMNEDGDIINIFTEVALAFFDRMDSDRKLPFLIQDIARTHPEFFKRYNEVFNSTCLESIGKHSKRLEQYVRDGILSECSMMDICDTVFTLATAPFLNIPLLENVAGLSKEAVNAYVADKRSRVPSVIRTLFSPC